MSTHQKGIWNRLLTLIGGGPARGSSVPLGATESELRSRIATLEMDLQQRDEQIAAMKRDYTLVESARDRAAATGGQEQIERLFKKMCGPLSNMATLAAAERAGKAVEAADMARLVGDLQKALTGAGLEVIGEPGQAAEFDTSAHQRMSGGAVHAGSPVVVRIPGYRMGGKVLQKAMVSAQED